jgi:CBS domain-containing protein
MAVTVGEIMNRELYATRPGESAANVLQDLMGLGIGGCPVVDRENRPVGVVSVRDLFGEADARVGDRMSSPALVLHESAPIREAARLMAEAEVHRIVVVDDQRAVGIVSSLDVIRGLLGLPSRHPVTFPHYDVETGLVWTDDHPLDAAHVEAAPDGPGVLLLIRGGVGRPETIVWGEAAENVRERLLDHLLTKIDGPNEISYWRDRGELRFRAAASSDKEECEGVLEQLLDEDHRIST